MSSTAQKYRLFSSVFLLVSALTATPCLAQVVKIELNSIHDGDKVRGLAMLRDDEAILTFIDRGERLELSEWNCTTGEERAILQAEGGQSVPVDFRVSVDSKYLIFARTGRGAWSFETVNIESGEVLASVKFRDADGFADDSREFKSPERIEFSPDLATAFVIFNKNSADQLPPHSELRVYDTKSGALRRQVAIHAFDRNGVRQYACPFSDVSASPDGRMIATVGGEKKISNVLNVLDADPTTINASIKVDVPDVPEGITEIVRWTGKDSLITVTNGHATKKQRNVFAVQNFRLRDGKLEQSVATWYSDQTFYYEDLIPRTGSVQMSPDGRRISVDNGWKVFQVFSVKTGKAMLTNSLSDRLGEYVHAPVFCSKSPALWYVNEKAELTLYKDADPDAARSIRK